MAFNRKKSPGFTLVELMVVLVILGIVSIGAITAITSQNKVYHSEEDLIDMQMNARVSMDRICFLLRMAGVGCSDSFGNKLDKGNLATIGDVAANPTTSMFAIVNNAPGTPDQLTLVEAVRHAGSVTSVTSSEIILDTTDHKLKGATTPLPKSYIFISPNDNNSFRTISGGDDTSKILTPLIALETPETTEINSAITLGMQIDVYQVQAFTIRLVDTNGIRSLRIDDNIATTSTQLNVADNIQDLQFQYWLDTGSDWENDTTDIHRIKAIRVFILARTGKIDKEYTDRKKYTLAGVEVGPFNDHSHRLLLESTITVRNRNF